MKEQRDQDLQALDTLAKELGLAHGAALGHMLAEAYRRDPAALRLRMIVIQQELATPKSPPGSYRAAAGLLAREDSWAAPPTQDLLPIGEPEPVQADFGLDASSAPPPE